MRVVLTGGGTGGHLMPFEGMVAGLRSVFIERKDDLPSHVGHKELAVVFLGIADEAAKIFFASYDVPVIHIPSGKLRRYVSALTLSDLLFRFPIGLALALFHMWRLMPDVVISKGGYGSLPVALAAILYRIPILLHESDAVPGITNRWLARFSWAITTSFPTADDHLKRWQYKVFVIGTPTRTQLTSISQSEAKRVFNIPVEEKVLLVVGGSQGAKQINEALLQVLSKLILEAVVIHITGRDHFEATATVAGEVLANSSRKDMYKPYAYLTNEMIYALAAADAIVSRAGASTLAEIARLRKPALLIPLESAAGDHQRLNAQAFEAARAAIVLDTNNLGKHLFLQNIERLLTDAKLRQSLAENLKKLDHPQAGRNIAELAFKLAMGLAPRKK